MDWELIIAAAGFAAVACICAWITVKEEKEAVKTAREFLESQKMRKVYVCSQYATRGNRETNLEFAKVFCMQVIEEGKLPVCPHLFFGGVLNDDVESQRAAGLRMGLELLKDCDELRIYSRLSDGMKGEIAEAIRLGIPVSIGNLAYIYSEDQAAVLEQEILEDLEEIRIGQEHHTEENR